MELGVGMRDHYVSSWRKATNSKLWGGCIIAQHVLYLYSYSSQFPEKKTPLLSAFEDEPLRLTILFCFF